MNVPIQRLLLLACFLTLLSGSLGCSILGFSAYPVAHVMTRDTQDVLEQSPVRPPVARELSKEVRPAHFLQPGDELLLEVIESESDVRLPADQRIMADGTLDLAKYGRVVVAGLTLEQVESIIQDRIADIDEEPARINVQLIQPIHVYYVIGEVNSPGAYPLTGHETVLDAIMEAGGLTDRASACDLLLARPTDPCTCRITLPVCYRSITQLGDTTTNYHLRPGDRIFVARQSFCEEMLAYIKGPQPCDRCCAAQVACRNPRSVQTSDPEFVPAGTVIIPAAQPPEITPGQQDATEVMPPPGDPSPAEMPTQDAGSDTPFDGELDFESMLDSDGS